MMMSDVIDERIQPLVTTMNTCGFSTFASGEGHVFPADSRLPYVVFYCDMVAVAGLEKLLRSDAECEHSQLNWGWTITGSFNPAAKFGFNMRPTRPYFIWHRFLCYSLAGDFEILACFRRDTVSSRCNISMAVSPRAWFLSRVLWIVFCIRRRSKRGMGAMIGIA